MRSVRMNLKINRCTFFACAGFLRDGRHRGVLVTQWVAWLIMRNGVKKTRRKKQKRIRARNRAQARRTRGALARKRARGSRADARGMARGSAVPQARRVPSARIRRRIRPRSRHLLALFGAQRRAIRLARSMLAAAGARTCASPTPSSSSTNSCASSACSRRSRPTGRYLSSRV